MKKIETIEELHVLLLDIGKEFHQICVRNNIPYYMLGGTQLGASRHKGFIPWDDDMDFGIPREYYEKFQVIAENELPEQYRLLKLDNSKRIISLISKIELKTTVIKERYYKGQQNQIGVFIDIFPLDKTNGNLNIFSKNKIIRFLIDVSGYRFLPLYNRPFAKKIIAFIIKVLLAPITTQSLMHFIQDHLISDSGNYLANHFGAWKTKEIMPIEYFGTPTLYRFEGTEFFGVEKPDNYLTHLYGDWRILPPEEKRHIHVLDMYYKCDVRSNFKIYS